METFSKIKTLARVRDQLVSVLSREHDALLKKDEEETKAEVEELKLRQRGPHGELGHRMWEGEGGHRHSRRSESWAPSSVCLLIMTETLV